jgi:PAS domain S-box-containing protein
MPSGLVGNADIDHCERLVSAAASHPLIQSGLVGEALEDGPVTVAVTDEHGRYVAVNRYLCELLGYDREELLGRRLGELSGLDEAEVMRGYDRTRAEGETSGRLRVRRKDGTPLVLAYRAKATRVAGMEFVVGVGWLEER